MNYKSKSLLVLCAFIFLNGVLNAYGQEPYIIDVAKGMKTAGNHYLSSIAASVEYIPLEAQEGTYTTDVRKWDIGEEIILVVSGDNKRFMQFGGNGKYVRDFLEQGKGPNEFIWIYSVDINDENEILISKDQNILEIYSDKAELRTRFTSKGNAGDAKWISNNRIAVYFSYPNNLSNDGYHLNIYSHGGELEGKHIYREDQGQIIRPPYFFNNICPTGDDGLLYYDI